MGPRRAAPLEVSRSRVDLLLKGAGLLVPVGAHGLVQNGTEQPGSCSQAPRFETSLSLHELVPNALRDGPCLDAARRQQVNRWNHREAEQRWPEFTRVAQEMGLRSYLSAGLGWAGRQLGALNLSSRDTDGFSQLDEGILALFTAPAAAVIVVASRYSEARDLATQLEQALRSRAVIDQAIGIVMAESRCDAEQAFATLGRASNNRNMKLRDLATEIVTRVVLLDEGINEAGALGTSRG